MGNCCQGPTHIPDDLDQDRKQPGDYIDNEKDPDAE